MKLSLVLLSLISVQAFAVDMSQYKKASVKELKKTLTSIQLSLSFL